MSALSQNALHERLTERERSRSRLEPCMFLADAARQMGVSRKTLREWLRVELGIIFPPGHRGVRRLVRIKDVEVLMRVHAGYPDWTRARGGSRSQNAESVPQP